MRSPYNLIRLFDCFSRTITAIHRIRGLLVEEKPSDQKVWGAIPECVLISAAMVVFLLKDRVTLSVNG